MHFDPLGSLKSCSSIESDRRGVVRGDHHMSSIFMPSQDLPEKTLDQETSDPLSSRRWVDCDG
jgi:hypothetical protein